MPNEKMLEDEFKVSRTTVRRAISLLSNEGVISVKQGKGTEVLDASTTQKLNSITSITETLQNSGHIVKTRGMHIIKENASESVAEKLEIDTNTYVYKVQRVQCVDNKPFALMTNYVKASIAPDLESYQNKFVSLYKFLENEYHVVYREAVEYFTAIAANFEESQILQIPVGYPLLRSKRIVSDEKGPFEYGIVKMISDNYEYCVYLRNR